MTRAGAAPSVRPITTYTSHEKRAGLHLAAWSLIGDLDLEHLLARLVDTSVDLVGASHGAVTTVDRAGRIRRIVYAGRPGAGTEVSDRAAGDGAADDRAVFGYLRIGEKAAAIPARGRHLRVPLRNGHENFGSIHLACSGGGFSAEDAELVAALASAAGVAIKNARRHEEVLLKQRASAAQAQLNLALIGAENDDVFGAVARAVAGVVPAAFVTVVGRHDEPDQLVVKAALGKHAEELAGAVYRAEGTLAERAISTERIATSRGRHEILSGTATVRYSCIVAVPLVGTTGALGAFHVAREDGWPDFSPAELTNLSTFGWWAGHSVESALKRAAEREEAVTDDRKRIARDLHDTVIQRLFATGLGLQALGSMHPAVRRALDTQIQQIDASIVDLRTAVFGLAAKPPARVVELRHRVIQTIAELTSGLGVSPRLTFSGPADLLLSTSLAEDIVAVVRETVSNIIRHARAQWSEVVIDINDAEVEVVVDDNGIGVEPGLRPDSGTQNLAERARLRGGTFTVLPREERGTRAAWTVPLEQAIEP